MEHEYNISPEELDLVDQYLLGRMSADALAAFELRLAGDQSLRRKVEDVQVLMQGIEEGALRLRMDEFHAVLHPDEVPETERGRVFPWRRWLAAAAVLLLFSGAGWWALRPSADERLYARFFRPDPGLATVMGVSYNYDFDRAMVDYKTGDYNAALSTWEPMLARNPDNDTLNYFVGTAWLAEGDAVKSIDPLRRVATMRSSYFLDDARWYLGLALLKEGRKQEAATYLQQSDHADKDALLRQLKPQP